MPEISKAPQHGQPVKPVDWSSLQSLLDSGGISLKIKDPSSGEMEEADEFEHVVFKTPDVEPTSFIGRCYAQIRQIRKELETLKESAERQPRVEEIAKFLSYPNPLLREAVTKVLARLGEDGVWALRQQLQSGSAPLTEAALLALGAIEHRRLKGSSAESALAMAGCLKSGSPAVREAAVRALRFTGTELCQELLLEKLEEPDYPERGSIIRELSILNSALVKGELFRQCLGDREADFKLHEIPHEAAFILRAPDIAQKISSPLIRKMALRFGYIDEALSAELEAPSSPSVIRNASELIETIGVATLSMANALEGAENRDVLLKKWRDRKQSFQWAFLGDEYVTTKQPVKINLDDSPETQIDRAVLFAALREDDLCNLDDKAEPKPFDREHEEKVPGSFFFLSFSGFERFYLKPALNLAGKLLETASPGVAEKLLPFSVFENLASMTHNDPEKLKEAELIYLAKWQFASHFVEQDGGGFTLKKEIAKCPDEKILKIQQAVTQSFEKTVQELERSANHHLWRFLISRPEVEHRAFEIVNSVEALKGFEDLSSGTKSLIKILSRLSPEALEENSARNRLVSDLLGKEKQLKKYLPSIGIELQNDTVKEEKTWAWKSLLEACGVPSPRRPEYLAMVEAAFNPSWDSESLAQAAASLLSFGFCSDYRRGMALHITLGGEFGAEAKYLALGLMSLSADMPPSKCSHEHWLKSLGGLMSKGLLYRKVKNEREALIPPSPSDRSPDMGLEVRVLTLQNPADSRDNAQEMLEESLPAAQYLAGALKAWKKKQSGEKCDEVTEKLASVWANYQGSLSELYSSGPAAQSGILSADWYGSTGDSRDRELTSELEIVSALERFQKMAEDPAVWSPLKERTRQILSSAVLEAKKAVMADPV